VDGINSTSTLDGSTPGAPVTIAGNLVVTNSNTLQLAGTINNKGFIAIKSTGNNTAVIVIGDTALQGGGKVLLTNNAHNVIQAPGVTLVNVNNTISGGGTIGSGSTLINGSKGVIDATGSLLVNTSATNTPAAYKQAAPDRQRQCARCRSQSRSVG
jgi:hypothetical protein